MKLAVIHRENIQGSIEAVRESPEDLGSFQYPARRTTYKGGKNCLLLSGSRLNINMESLTFIVQN